MDESVKNLDVINSIISLHVMNAVMSQNTIGEIVKDVMRMPNGDDGGFDRRRGGFGTVRS